MYNIIKELHYKIENIIYNTIKLYTIFLFDMKLHNATFGMRTITRNFHSVKRVAIR